MHAVVSTVNITDAQVARAALAELRTSAVSRAAEFVAGYRLAAAEGVGMSVIVFATREHAELALTHQLAPLPGVTPMSVQIREVYAHA